MSSWQSLLISVFDLNFNPQFLIDTMNGRRASYEPSTAERLTRLNIFVGTNALLSIIYSRPAHCSLTHCSLITATHEILPACFR